MTSSEVDLARDAWSQASGLLKEPLGGGGVLVGGVWRDGSRGSFPVLDPSTGTTLAEIADAGEADAQAALAAASSAQDSLGSWSYRRRADILRAAYDELLLREDLFATLITLEMGKPFSESVGEVRYAAEYLRWFSEETPRISGESRVLPDGTSRMETVPRPVGVCVLVTPWNFPLAMITRKVAPAISAGCASIIKPAAETPLTTLAFAELLRKLGIPKGAVNVLPTRAPGPLVKTLLADGRPRKISFTGSTEVGRQLLGLAAGQIMRSSMELGGNAPFVVFEDADLDQAVDAAMLAKFRNGGQACTAANRFFVHEDVADEFVSALCQRIQELKFGHGLVSDTTLGPVIHDRARTQILDLVNSAIDQGADLVTGGGVPDRPGSFIEPTVVTNVSESARLRTDEVFGPVVSVSTFRDDHDVIARANATPYGLASYAFTQDEARQRLLSRRLQYGMVAINRGLVSNAAAPFGGIKHSGLGREGSREGLDEYLDYVYVARNS